MPNILHSQISGNELHEPKGVDSASGGEVYVSDGLGSGAWQSSILNTYEKYTNAGSSQTLVADTALDLTNDGDTSSLSLKHPNSTGVWNTTDNQFEWDSAGLSLGDSVRVSVDLNLTTSLGNTAYTVSLDLAEGSGSETSVLLGSGLIVTAGTNQLNFEKSFCIDSADILDNPAKVSVTVDMAGSVVANHFSVFSSLREVFYQ